MDRCDSRTARRRPRRARRADRRGHPVGGIARTYAELDLLTGSAVVSLNRAVAVAEDQGSAAGLALLDGLDDRLPGSQLLPANPAAQLARVDLVQAAAEAYDLTLEGCARRRHLLAARAALGAG